MTIGKRKWKKARSILQGPSDAEIYNWGHPPPTPPISMSDVNYDYKIVQEIQQGFHISTYTDEGWEIVQVVPKREEVITYEYIIRKRSVQKVQGQKGTSKS